MYFLKPQATDLFRLSFRYRSEYGHFFKQSERKLLAVAIENTCGQDLDVYLNHRIVGYTGKKVFEEEYHVFVGAGKTAESEFEFPAKELGYYDWFCMVKSPAIWLTQRVGVGVIRDEDPPGQEDSPFGLCCNFWSPDRQLPIFKRMGAKLLRVSASEPARLAGKMEEYSLLAMCQQVGGRVGDWDVRFAPPEANTSYQYTKANPNVRLQEHGNECWEEPDLTRLAEWTKVSHFAKIKANPRGFYSPSGIAGSDVNRFSHLFRQGLRPYINYLGIHPYTFPKAPELDNGFWSFQGLRALASLNNAYGALPVVASEQGYPAMDDQESCEAYSPEDMVTKEAQADYLVRKYVLLLSYGVSRILWFNGPWYNGFGIMERDGMAPWPAAVAFCEMTRRLEGARYAGDLALGNEAQCKVFEKDGRVFAVAWRPLLRSRSWQKACNYTLDGLHRESEGVSLEPFAFRIPFSSAATAFDIFGNTVEVKRDGELVLAALGESPLYIDDLDAGILEAAAEDVRTLFPPMTEQETPLPPSVILGIQDEKPVRGAYHTAEILPGETRTLLVRVHNYSDRPLDDVVLLDLPAGFSGESRRAVQVKPGELVTLAFSLRCGAAESAGEREVGALLESGAGLPVMQLYRVACPFGLAPVRESIGTIARLRVRCHNPQTVPVRYTMRADVEGLEIQGETMTVQPGETSGLELAAIPTAEQIGTMCRLEAVTPEGTAVYTLPIPLYRIERYTVWNPAGVQPFLIAGSCIQAAVMAERAGPELLGEAKPNPSVSATVRLGIVEGKLMVYVDVVDDDLIFVQNTRRDNADCDGVWLNLYEEEEEPPRYRFCMTPADPSGRAENATVREFVGDIPWNAPYSGFDLAALDFRATVWHEPDDTHEKGYALSLGIPLESIERTGREKFLYAGFRVIDMDSGDWPQLYDTGKIKFSIAP